jgi:hypothetical protein
LAVGIALPLTWKYHALQVGFVGKQARQFDMLIVQCFVANCSFSNRRLRMKKNVFRSILLSAGLALISAQAVQAQSSFDGLKDLSTKDPAANVSTDNKEPVNADLSKNKIDTSGDAAIPLSPQTTTTPVAPYLDPYKAQGGPLTLFNCNSGGISVKTYNSNDGAMWIPYKTVGIATGKTSGLKCATSSCKLQIGGLKTAALSGYQVYVAGKVRTTNQDAIKAGCNIYK